MIILKNSTKEISKSLKIPIININHFELEKYESDVNIILINDLYSSEVLEKLINSNANIYVLCDQIENLVIKEKNFIYLFNETIEDSIQKIKKTILINSLNKVDENYKEILEGYNTKIKSMEESIELLQIGMAELSKSNTELAFNNWDKDTKEK